MIVLVCGGRSFSDVDFLEKKLSELNISCIVHGGALGADYLAGQYAISNSIPEIVIKPQWTNFGKSAGVIRNSWMIKFIPVDLVMAFPGGVGTRNMIEQAKQKGIKVSINTPDVGLSE